MDRHERGLFWALPIIFGAVVLLLGYSAKRIESLERELRDCGQEAQQCQHGWQESSKQFDEAIDLAKQCGEALMACCPLEGKR
jgi:hypothetical protein